MNMSYYCDVCDKTIKLKSKNNHLKSLSHREFDKCIYMKITIKKPDINKTDKIFYSYIIEHNKKYDYYLIKCDFKLVFNNSEFSPHITSKLSDNKTMFSWSKFSEKVIDNFKIKGYTFNHIAEMNIITIANKLDISYDIYINHNMHAIEWKINAVNNKNENLIIKLLNNNLPLEIFLMFHLIISK